MSSVRPVVFGCAALAACGASLAEAPPPAAQGSTAFCLFQVPTDDPSRQRWINLGIVQYVEVAPTELRVVFGGGNFGAGHELHLAYPSADEAAAELDRMRQAAADCMGRQP